MYEAFLTDEEIAAHAQEQRPDDARLARLLRESDGGSTSSSMTAESDRPHIGSEEISTSRPATVQMEVDVETITEIQDTASLQTGRNQEDTSNAQEGDILEGQPLRRQPRRVPAISDWHLSSNGELSPAPVGDAIPHISVAPIDSRDGTSTSSRSPSPDPLNLVSGLQYLSDSPRPLAGIEFPRPISPVPNTPARVSGFFSTPPSAQAAATPSPAPTMTPRILTWGSLSEGIWVQESPTAMPQAHYFGSRLSATPAPLTS